MVITPHHDYYPLTPQAQEQVPRFMWKWITPREPPDQHVVSLYAEHKYLLLFFDRTCRLIVLYFLLSIDEVQSSKIFKIQVLTVGALHQYDFSALRSAASKWHDEFAPLPKPLLVVNIGGPTSEFINILNGHTRSIFPLSSFSLFYYINHACL